MTELSTILYSVDNDGRLCKITVPVPLNRVTLADFKRKLPRSHANKYSFIFEEHEISIGKTVDTHIDNDNQVLPNVDGKVKARLVAKDSDEDNNSTNANLPIQYAHPVQSNGKPRDVRSTGSGGNNGEHTLFVGSRRGGSEGTGSIINSFRDSRLQMPNNGSSSASRHTAAAYDQNASSSSAYRFTGNYTEDDGDDGDIRNADTCGEDGDESTNFFADTDDGSLSMATGNTGSIANQYHNRIRRQMINDANTGIRSGYPNGEVRGISAYRRFPASAADRAYPPPAPPASALLGPPFQERSAITAGGVEAASLAYLVDTGQLSAVDISFDLFQSGHELGLQLIDDNYNPHGMGGICISAVSPNEAVARDGRIEPGDVLLRINDTSIIDYGTAEEAVRVLTQAAEMSKQGHGPVRLTVVKHVAAWAQNSGRGNSAHVSKFERGGPVMPIDTRCWIQSQQEFDDMRARGELQPPLDAVTTVDSQPGNMHDSSLSQHYTRNNNIITGGMRMLSNNRCQQEQPVVDQHALFNTNRLNVDASLTPYDVADNVALATANRAQNGSSTAGAPSTIFDSPHNGAQYCLTSTMDLGVVVRAMRHPVSGIKLKHHEWLKIWIPQAFTGAELIGWLRTNVKDLNDRNSKSTCKSYAKRLLAQGFIRDPFKTNSTAFDEHRTYVFAGDHNSSFHQQQMINSADNNNGMTTPTSLITTSTTLTSNKLSDTIQQRTPNMISQHHHMAGTGALQQQQPTATTASPFANAMHDDADDVEGLGTLRNDHHDHLRQVIYEDKADNITPDDSVSQVASSHDSFPRTMLIGGGGGLPPYPMPHHFNQQSRLRGGFAQHQGAGLQAGNGNHYSGSPALSAQYMRKTNNSQQPSYADDAIVRLSTLGGVQPSPKLLNYNDLRH